jgi:hypothetical protein
MCELPLYSIRSSYRNKGKGKGNEIKKNQRQLAKYTSRGVDLTRKNIVSLSLFLYPCSTRYSFEPASEKRSWSRVESV